MKRAGVALSGEIDLIAAPEVRARLARETGGDGDLVVDARDVSFIDVAGCRELVEAARRLPEGRRLVVVGGPRSLARLMDLCGWRHEGRIVLVSGAETAGKEKS
jgi:anti-anti-sigma factor